MRIKMTQLVAAAAALTLAVGSAHAAPVVIYQDDFSGGTGDINGVAPDTAPGAETWVASSQFNADGSIANIGAAGIQGGSATLAFTPTNGLIYTLDASFTGINGNANFLALGFVEGQSTTNTFEDRFISGNVIGKAWMIVRGDNDPNPNVAFLGINDGGSNAGNSDGDDFSPAVEGSAVDFRVVLDTTGGAGAWTATWFAKLATDATYSEVRAEATLLDETIDAVGIAKSNDGITGTITSFSLTSVVPEPSSLALLGLGGLLIARRRRD